MLLQAGPLPAHQHRLQPQCRYDRQHQRNVFRRCSGGVAAARAAASRAVVRPITPQPAPINPSTGFVANEADLNKIPTEWHSLLQSVTTACKQACGSALLGVYLRGSLPRGCFIPHVSDVDTFALVLAPASKTTSSSSSSSSSSSMDGNGSSSSSRAAEVTLLGQMQQQLKEAAAVLRAEHAHLCFVKLEAKVLPVAAGSAAARVLQQHMAAPSSSRSSCCSYLPALTPSMLVSIPAAFELKTQSVCLAGVDLPQLLPAAAALPSGLQLLPGLAEDVEAAREKAAEAAQEGDFAQQVTVARWCLKRLLRAAFELVQQQAGVYTRDLYWCCHFAGQQLQQLQQQLEQALELYVQLQGSASMEQQEQHQVPKAVIERLQVEQQQLLSAAWQLTDALLPRVEALFLKQMLTEEPGWLTKHIAEPISSSSPSLMSSSIHMPAIQQQEEQQQQQQQQWGWAALQSQMQGLLAAVTGATARHSPGPYATATKHSNSSGTSSTLAAAGCAGLSSEPQMLLGAAPPPVQLPVWGSVIECNWADQAERAAACATISAVLVQQSSRRGLSSSSRTWRVHSQAHQQVLVSDSEDAQAAAAERLLILQAEQQPLLLRGLAANWPAVSQQGWGLGWLAQQGFSGKVRLAPSLQFPFVEPQLVQYLDHIAGPAAAPSRVVDMSIAEFVARLQPGCRLPPLLYKPHEHYYMQAHLPPHMEQQLLLQELLQHLEARGCNTSVSATLASRTESADTTASTAANPAAAAAAAAAEDEEESCKLFFSQEPRVWVSPAGAASPLHYDTSHSFLLQVRGFKRMLFISPEQLYRLYCYPDTHLLRRRSRVNVHSPDLAKHPLFAGVGALEVVLGPGDAVFFPSMWAHYTESLGECVAEGGETQDSTGSSSSSAATSSVCGCSVSVTFRVAQA